MRRGQLVLLGGILLGLVSPVLAHGGERLETLSGDVLLPIWPAQPMNACDQYAACPMLVDVSYRDHAVADLWTRVPLGHSLLFRAHDTGGMSGMLTSWRVCFYDDRDARVGCDGGAMRENDLMGAVPHGAETVRILLIDNPYRPYDLDLYQLHLPG